jgi:hypothetical protein
MGVAGRRVRDATSTASSMSSASSRMRPPTTSLSFMTGPSVTNGPSGPGPTVQALADWSSSAPPRTIFPARCHFSHQASTWSVSPDCTAAPTQCDSSPVMINA